MISTRRSVGSGWLGQGPTATHGFRYAITLQNFPPNQAIAVNCYDSVDTAGFFPFTMHTDGAGHAYTQSQCYSADGPDHWVVAGGIESSHVTWGGARPGAGSSGGGNPGGGQTGSGSGSGATPPSKPSGPTSVFFSPDSTATGLDGVTAADLNLTADKWSAGDCQATKADDFDGPSVTTLAGWSVGRLGPIYFLGAASSDRVAKVRTIILFDPGSTSDFANPPLLEAGCR